MSEREFGALSRALDVVNADVRATGLPGTLRLVRPEWADQNVFVETWDGGHGSGSGIFPDNGGAVPALVAVADEAQDAVMESIWGAWPVCPAHDLGVHAEERDGYAVWRCQGGGGHTVARIGQWR